MSSPSQLFSCVETEALLKSPLNNSPSKQLWTFNKDSRFKRPRIYCDSFYEVPGIEQNRNRRAAFGYGKKSGLDLNGHRPNEDGPSPASYDISSFVDTNKLHRKGFTALFSREQVSPMSYIQLQGCKVPGPGRYDQYRQNSSPRWSLHRRFSAEVFGQSGGRVPGPGSYGQREAIEHNLEGHYLLSNHASSRAKVFDPPRSRRFNKSTTDVPGPGVYRPYNDLSNKGKYILSKHISAGKRKFLDGRRLSFTQITAKKSFTPGPGTYRAASEFGHYDSNKEVRASSTSERAANASSKTERTKLSEKNGRG